MIGNELHAALIFVLFTFGITFGKIIGSSPCPEIFQYEKFSNGEWHAKLTLNSDLDLHGVWIRMLTEPKIAEVTPPEGFNVKNNETAHTLIFNREYLLRANTPQSFQIRGASINGETPELMQIVLNGKTICSSYKLEKNSLYEGDLNNKDYLSTITQRKLNQNNTKSTQCGNPSVNKYVYPSDGLKLKKNQFPWQALLFSRDTLSFLCEATLISEDALLTAAHCATEQKSRIPISPSHLIVKLKNEYVDEENNELLQVERVIVHPEFNEENLENDIAILKLEKALTIDRSTQPICLPKNKEIIEFLPLLGYGFREDGTMESLRVTSLDVLTEENCIKMEPLYRSLMNVNNFCAVYNRDKEICVGTSGSPVIDHLVEPWMIWELKGIVSIGRGLHDKFKCDTSSPILVVNVGSYVKWIRSNLNG